MTTLPARRRIRWSDHDRYLGPFTYARSSSKNGSYGIVLGSGDDEDPGCTMRLSLGSHTLLFPLPDIIQPDRKKIPAKSWDAATIERLGRDWYYDTHEREYGFSCTEGFFNVYLGRQTHDSSTEQRWACFLPWTQWRFVRWSFYGLEGEHVWTEPKRLKRKQRTPEKDRAEYDALQVAKDTCPKRSFAFKDFDGEQLTAETRIDEREWHFGEGWFKWLSIFRRPKISRSLDIQFSGETGKRKGSWKGGTIGHGINVLPGELHEAAFRRYCAAHEMSFVGDAPAPALV